MKRRDFIKGAAVTAAAALVPALSTAPSLATVGVDLANTPDETVVMLISTPTGDNNLFYREFMKHADSEIRRVTYMDWPSLGNPH